VLRSIPSGWRHTAMPREAIAFRCGQEEIALGYRAGRAGTFSFSVDGAERVVIVQCAGEGVTEIAVDGVRVRFLAEPAGATWLMHGPLGDLALEELPRFPDPAAQDLTGGLKAPMPGLVRAVSAAPGDTVEKGRLLLVLEAMKMEHRIVAPRDGVVSAVHVALGEQVGAGQLLLTLDDSDGDTRKGEKS
jgi:propionyl-CoA carboxylase alpha chain